MTEPQTEPAPMIRTRGLTKHFGHVHAVEAVDLEVGEGEIYGFLGPNGSGKTTTVRMLLGLVLATSGTVEMMGRSMPQHSGDVLPDVGSLVEGPAAYPGLSGRTNLSLLDAMGPGGVRRTRSDRIEEALAEVGLAGVDRRPVRTYSLGMRQRLGLAAALIRRPRLLVLDEPTNGLDPQGIHEIRELLLRLNRDGTTIFLSSHLLAEVEHLCDRVGVLDRGRMVLQESLADIRRPTGRLLVRTRDVDRARALLDGQVEAADGQRLVVRYDDPAALNRLLVEGGVRVSELAPERRTLEEVVLRATTSGSDRVVRPDDDDAGDVVAS
jgi:ABC-type multidrug transport system ATPase subunit